MTDTPGPLQLASTDDLIEELKNRHDALLLIRTVASPKGDATYYHTIDITGGLVICMGLAWYALRHLELPESLVDVDDD